MPLLDLDDIQGNVIVPYATTYAHYAFLRFADVGRPLRTWLCKLSKTLTTAARPPDRATLNLALSAAGMDALGLPVDAAQALPVAFRAGMSRRAEILGDVDESAPERWEHGEQQWSDVHAVLTVSAWSADECRTLSGEVLAIGDVQVLHHQDAAALDESLQPFAPGCRSKAGRYEHFGFRDGLSDLVIEGTSRTFAPGQGTRRDGRWQPIKPGEFILGYEDQTRVVALPRVLRRYLRNGSYLVWRKLRQDVRDFCGAVPEAADRARIVGRWPDGTPLALSPAPAGHDRETEPSNDFGYAGDPQGRLCPASAHIRRANPRDALDFADEGVDRHRLIRRGMPYTDQPDDKGLIFVCFNADLERQFEFVQQRWIVGDPARIDHGPDVIAAPSAARRMRTYVRTRGGQYFFQPGLLGLRRLLGDSAFKRP